MSEKYFALFDGEAVYGIGDSFRDALEDWRNDAGFEVELWVDRYGFDLQTLSIDDLRGCENPNMQMRLIRLTPEAYADLIQMGWVSEERLKRYNGEFGTKAVWRDD